MTAAQAVDVVLVSCEQFPELTGDDRLLLAALKKRGAVNVKIVSWCDCPDQQSAQTRECRDNKTFNWNTAALVVLRSPWDYTKRCDDFLAWVRRVEVQACLANRNANKSCLIDLTEAGAPSVPSVFLPLVPRRKTCALR